MLGAGRVRVRVRVRVPVPVPVAGEGGQKGQKEARNAVIHLGTRVLSFGYCSWLLIQFASLAVLCSCVLCVLVFAGPGK